MSRPFGKSTRGFTLIELLVVIAIIALLVSILVPALTTARKIAQKTLCGTHLKNMGTALNMYLNDNIDYIPPYSCVRFNATLGKKYTWMWQDFLIPYCDTQAVSNDGSGPGPDWNVVANQNYVNNPTIHWNSNHIVYSKLMNCPSQVTTGKLIHYGVNRDWKCDDTNPAASQTPKKISFCKNPTRYVYINESSKGGQEFDVPGSPNTMVLNVASNPVHIGLASNFCTAAGTVITMTASEMMGYYPWDTYINYPFHIPP